MTLIVDVAIAAISPCCTEASQIAGLGYRPVIQKWLKKKFSWNR